MCSYSFECDFYSYFKVGVEGLVVSSGQLANVSDKAFVGLEVTSFFFLKNLEERSFLKFFMGKDLFKKFSWRKMKLSNSLFGEKKLHTFIPQNCSVLNLCKLKFFLSCRTSW